MRRLFRSLYWSYVHWRCTRLLEFWSECAGYTGGLDVKEEILRRVAPWRESEFEAEVQFFVSACARIELWEQEQREQWVRENWTEWRANQIQKQTTQQNARVGVIAIHYTGGDPETYECVTLSIGNDEFSWYTPPQQAYDAALALAALHGVHVAHSSTIDNYKMDGGLLLA